MKKELSPNELLERAETFFAKRNFPLAKKFFEQYPYGLLSDEVTKKIAICTTAINNERSKTLIKKSKKLFKKNKKEVAVELLKEAYELSGDETIKQRIDAIAGKEQIEQEFHAAEQATAAGNYALAAEIYKKYFIAEANSSLFIHLLFNTIQVDAGVRKSRHLLKKYHDQLTDLAALTDRQLYQLGYVYYKLTDFAMASRLWRQCNIQTPEFKEQQNSLLVLWEQQLYKHSQSIKQFPALLSEAEEFLTYRPSQTVSDIIRQAQLKQAEVLFNRQQYRGALELLLPLPAKLNAAEVRLYAGIYYHIVKFSDDVNRSDIVHLCELSQNIVYNQSLSSVNYQTSQALIEAAEKNRQELIKLNIKYKVFVEYYLTRTVNHLQQMQQEFSAVKQDALVLTPILAMLMDKNTEIVALYNELGHSIDDNAIYDNKIQLAVYRSLNDAEYANNHQQQLPTVGQGVGGIKLIKQLHLDLAIMAYCEDDQRKFEQHLVKSAELFYTGEMFNLILAVLNPQELALPYLIIIDKLLAPVFKKSKDKIFCEKCSRYSLKKILLQYEDNLKKSVVLKHEIHKIFSKLHQDIPAAYIEILEDAEINEIAHLIRQKNIQQASKIAEESAFETVREFFFEQIGEIMAMVAEHDDHDWLIAVAAKFYPHCCRVDPDHTITRMLRNPLR